MRHAIFPIGLAWATGAVLTLVLLAALGCAGRGSMPNAATSLQPGFSVLWPPPAGVIRQTSDDVVRLRGIEHSAVGGGTADVPPQLQLNGGSGLTWAIYSLGGFSTNVQPAQFDVDFSVTPATPGDGTALWVGLADYSVGRWTWTNAASPTYSDIPVDPLHFISPAGSAAIAVVITGPGSANISEVRLHRAGDTDIAVPQNLTGSAELGVVHLDWDDVPGVQGYHVYRSLTDTFTSPVRLTATPVTQSQYDDTTVGSDITYYYKVTAVKYNESAMSEMVMVHSPKDNLLTPQNLIAIPYVGQVQLQWDAVLDSTGYNVYRDVSWDFANPVKLNTKFVSGTEYTDDTVGGNRIYYYRVSAVHVGESGLSNMVDVYVPQADLPAPENPRATDITQEQFRVRWDWTAAGDISGFVVLVSTIPDFSLADEPERRTTLEFGRSILFPERDPETTYYFRIAAMDGSSLCGRMTNDIAVKTLGYWHWEDVDIIGNGSAPLVMVKDGNDLAVAYFNDKQVDVAWRMGGSWTVQPGVLSAANDGGGFSTYLDMASYGGNYVIATYATLPGDLWVATGSSSGWNAARVDGDGSTAIGHTASGDYCKVAAGPAEFAVLYRDDPAGSVVLRTSPVAGVSWSPSSTIANAVEPLYHSMAYDSLNLYIVRQDAGTQTLVLGDRDGGWAWTDIGNSGGEAFGAYNQLLKVGLDWWTPVVNDTTGDFYTLRGSGATWDKKTVSTVGNPGNPVGANARLTPFGANMAMVFFGYSPNRWYYGLYDSATGIWTIEQLMLSGVTPGFYMDIATLDGDPYIVFSDTSDQKIKCLKGTPPAV
jgi:hypothetical protein